MARVLLFAGGMRLPLLRRAACGLLLMLGLGACAALSAQEAGDDPAAVAPTTALPDLLRSDIADSLQPLQNARLDGNTGWQAAVALLADPVDTRLGRSFDIQVATLVRSFQFSGYVLQSYALPWKVGAKPSSEHRQVPGVLLFRRDSWRGANANGPAVDYFVVFLVGESPVFGIQRVAFCQAAAQARALNAGGPEPQHVDTAHCRQSRMAPPATPTIHPRSDGRNADIVPVLGPMFSGSLTSLVEVARATDLRLSLLSPSATVNSNHQVVELLPGQVSYRTFATWEQDAQLEFLFSYLFRSHAMCPDEVVILAEESSFGQGAIDLQLQGLGSRGDAALDCGGPHAVPRRLQFSQNISAIRAEHAQLDAARQGKVSLSLTPSRNLELDMKDAALSQDLPPVYQPSLTSRSDELSLQQLMDSLATRIRPKAVVVVATDVRDRLFMLGVVRRALPAALPIVLEGDHLLAHPDYRDANRGTLMVRNAAMNLCYSRDAGSGIWNLGCRNKGVEERRYFAFATDYAASLFKAARQLLEPASRGRLSTPERGTPLVVVTLAGTQAVDVARRGDDQMATREEEVDRLRQRARRGGDTLIASDLRLLVLRVLSPFGVLVCTCLLICSAWLALSSRPGRSILPLLRYAMREAGWSLERGLFRRHHDPGRAQRQPHPEPRRCDQSGRGWTWLLTGLALLLFCYAIWLWLQMLSAASIGSNRDADFTSVRYVLRLVHGRDLYMAFALAGLFGWFALLVLARIHAWNQRCHRHWQHGRRHPDRDPHAQRSYHGTALGVALMCSGPALLSWFARGPQALDHTGVTTILSFLLLTACLYFLVQAGLQTYRLFAIARSVRDDVLEKQPPELVPAGWPSPRLLGVPAQSPIAVLFRDRDWRVLEMGGDDWPWPPPTHPLSPTTHGYHPDEVKHWRARTVAEFRFGLSCVRSCLWVAFVGPLVLLGMIQAYPFAFEWEHSALALCVLGLAFAASAYITYQTEQAALIGQMFTQDGARVSIIDVLKALGGKLILLLLILAATLAPNLSHSLQNMVGMLGL